MADDYTILYHMSLLQNERRSALSFRPLLPCRFDLSPMSFRPQGDISGGKVRDFSLSLEMPGVTGYLYTIRIPT
jgi:hypothetical protein